ncbi:MAG: T9SS C-terminal target domain-containing protein [Bacteroidetes bacterium]|nr:MAG: T9SS C-terminal target domain-containing protein [Bacteroidota bacterium]
MKYTHFWLTLCLLLWGSLRAQQWDWVQTIAGVTCEGITDMAFLPDQDLLLTGIYEDRGGVTFGSADGAGQTFAANTDTFPYSHSTLFLARYTRAGTLKWVAHAYAESGIHPWEMAVDPQGYSTLCGNFRGRAIFRDTGGREQVLEGMRLSGDKQPPLNAFVARFSPEGQLLWAHVGLSRENSVAFEVETDAAGHVYLRAYCTYGAISFGDMTFIASPGEGRSFYNLGLLLLKFSPEGQLLWSLRGGNLKVDRMRVDPQGEIQLQGQFTAKALLWNSRGDVYDIAAPPARRTGTPRHRLRVDAQGRLLAVEPDFPALGAGAVVHEVQDAEGNTFALPQPWLGSDPRGLQYRLDWGEERFTTQRKDIFLAKFDSLQRPLWLIQMEGEYDEVPLDIALDQAGNVLIAGHFRQRITLKDRFKGSVELDAGMYQSLFLASYSPAGQLRWATKAGNYFDDTGEVMHLRVDTNNQLLVSGFFNAPTRLGSHILSPQGEKGYVSPSWPEPIDYRNCRDAYFACLNLVSESREVVENEAFREKWEKKEDDPASLPLSSPLAYAADTLFDQPSEAALDATEVPGLTARVFPNPVSQALPDLQAELQLPQAATVVWRLLSSEGRALWTESRDYPEGTAVFPFSMAGLAAGTYLLVIETGSERLVRRVVLW